MGWAALDAREAAETAARTQPATPAPTQPTDSTTPATDSARGFSGAGFVVGLLLCLTPVAPLGGALVAMFGLIYLLSPTVAVVEQKAHDAAVEHGGGCGWALVGALLIAVVIAVGVLGGMATVGGF